MGDLSDGALSIWKDRGKRKKSKDRAFAFCSYFNVEYYFSVWQEPEVDELIDADRTNIKDRGYIRLAWRNPTSGHRTITVEPEYERDVIRLSRPLVHMCLKPRQVTEEFLFFNVLRSGSARLSFRLKSNARFMPSVEFGVICTSMADAADDSGRVEAPGVLPTDELDPAIGLRDATLSTGGRGEAKLISLLADCFSVSELGRFARDVYPSLGAELPERVSVLELSNALVLKLKREGRLDAEFMQRLLKQRPRRQEELAAVCQALRIKMLW